VIIYLWAMKRIFTVLALLAQMTLLAQNNLTIKAGLEMDYKELDGLYVYTNDGSYYFTSGVAFSPIRSLQIGGRFGTDQLFEGGIGLGFGSIGFSTYEGEPLESSVFRKGIYMERYYSSSGRFVLGTGSQLYTYKMTLERTFDEDYLVGEQTGSCTWKANGLEWKLLARLYFGENENHSLQGFFSLAGELVKVSEFKVDNSKVEVLDETIGVLAAHVGISYAIVFNQRR
jgi:hypothetical protein